MKKSWLIGLFLLYFWPANAGPNVQPPPPSWEQWRCYMQGAIFNDDCHLFGPEAQRLLISCASDGQCPPFCQRP